MPEMVDLFAVNDTSNYSQRYVRAMRCSGRSTNSSLSCRATRSEQFQVKVFQLIGVKRFPVKVNVDVHIGCDFQCVDQPADCNVFQQLNECRCKCMNSEQENKCLKVRALLNLISFNYYIIYVCYCRILKQSGIQCSACANV